MSADTAVAKGSVKPAKSKSRRVPIWRRSPSLVVGAVIVLFTCIVAAFPIVCSVALRKRIARLVEEERSRNLSVSE